MKRIIMIILIVTIIISLFGLYKKMYNYDDIEIKNEKTVIPKELFSDFYDKAQLQLETMSLDEKIASLLLVRYPKNNQVKIQKEYQFGGYLFFAKDFKNKNRNEVMKMIEDVQKVSKIPMLIAVDEEGGKVVRVSSNNKLINEPFRSSSDLYNKGGLTLIYQDTLKKSTFLDNLGINLNLAPVVDIANIDDYIYERTLGKNNIITAEYAKTVIEASKKGKVSYTLKHFPGYGSNLDTHSGISIDLRSKKKIEEDLLPFKEGIKASAEAILVNHNIIKEIDSLNPASLSLKIHQILRQDLLFSGVIITDDISMQALNDISSPSVKALLSDNDLIITSDYQRSIQEIKKAIQEKEMSEELINKHALKVLSWKYYKNLL